MKTIVSILLFGAVCLTLPAHAGEREKSVPNYIVTGKTTDPALKKDEAVFALNFVLRGFKELPVKHNKVQMSYNGTVTTATTNDKGNYSLKVKPGKYVFQFFLNESYVEVYTDSIEVKGAGKTSVTVYFEQGEMRNVAEKPVIYLYPEKPTDVKVSLDVKGEMQFTYPAYGENGWSVTANPDGKLQQGDKTYNYLFWEASIPSMANNINSNQGYLVLQGDLLTFLETTLKNMGLQSSEAQDFITYWYPQMAKHSSTRIHFLMNDELNAYAALKIQPKPDRVLRIFMLWGEGSVGMANTDYVVPQVIPAFERKGFTVVEWGGMEVNGEKL